MNRLGGRSTTLGLILTLLVGFQALQAGCKFETKATPATQLVVDIDAETLIRNRLHSLEIEVAAARHRDNIDEREETFREELVPESLDSEALTWPVRVVLTPKDGDARRVLELTATALGLEGRFVARARLVTGYVTNQIRYSRLVLETECFEVECGDLETCRVGGCTDAFVEPRDLPLLPGPGMMPDAGEAGLPDTGPEPDAGFDAGADAGPDEVGS